MSICSLLSPVIIAAVFYLILENCFFKVYCFRITDKNHLVFDSQDTDFCNLSLLKEDLAVSSVHFWTLKGISRDNIKTARESGAFCIRNGKWGFVITGIFSSLLGLPSPDLPFGR
jgi:hypothetical protein